MKVLSKKYSITLFVFLLANYANTALAVTFDSGFVDPTPPTGASTSSFDVILHGITNWILGFAAAISVLMIIAGGVMYMTSAGDQTKADSGKKTVTNGIAGLVVVGLAYAIVVMIISMVT